MSLVGWPVGQAGVEVAGEETKQEQVGSGDDDAQQTCNRNVVMCINCLRDTSTKCLISKPKQSQGSQFTTSFHWHA